ncbi:MAG TPA: VOC family protein [Steroidobacteraceae bacterium]|nr:VOC family protein [Steroidobacteraceae bacterium]
MIGYACVGTNDFKRAIALYDALLAELGAKRVMDYETFVAWKQAKGKSGFALASPFDKKPATTGNGSMVAFEVGSPAEVDALYRKALALGATDEGPPGDRGDNYYGAYFRDPDGNKLNFHCFT